jgi:hypothetical protein
MIAVPVFPNVRSSLSGHSTKASFLKPIAREFQGFGLLVTSRETAGWKHSQVSAPKRQALKDENASISRFGFRVRAQDVPFAARFSDEFADVQPPLPRLTVFRIP